MDNIILRTNATPIYSFLSRINRQAPVCAGSQKKRVLDCGAGGPVPPVALFAQHGLNAWGIDISEAAIRQAQGFCREQSIDVHLETGDMRHLRFEDESFDYVYEHYAMCHLSKADTELAINEMHRVTMPGGLCFLGVISTDSWPKSLFGQETAPGEYMGEEGDEDAAPHTMFSDAEANRLVSAWEIVHKEMRTTYLRAAAEALSPEAWLAAYEETDRKLTRPAWEAQYKNRAAFVRYSHLYYVLRKSMS